MALAAPAGYALAKLRPPGGPALSFLLLIAQMIPGSSWRWASTPSSSPSAS
ncbi:hypothetical protein NKG94_21880 [Micromonospora sp. M12]